jgi:hypothetical protein
LWRRELQRRWVHEASYRDPDDLGVVMQDMRQDIEAVLRMLPEIAAEVGVDLDAPVPARVTVLDTERLRRASLALVGCLAGTTRNDDEAQDGATRELRRIAAKIAAKVARVGGYLGEDQAQETWAHDGEPNLLLLERLERQFREELARCPVRDQIEACATRALSDLDRVLGPLIAEVSAAARLTLAALEQRGLAPSPFVRTATPVEIPFPHPRR